MKNSTVCSNTVDYSKVAGDKILPFVFTLNLEDSILDPKEGEYQKFCYDIEGVGKEDSEYEEDLNHFLLGICKDITKDDIDQVTVVIDGVGQQVIWGKNGAISFLSLVFYLHFYNFIQNF